MLQYRTPGGWFAVASTDLCALLSDHLHCERKAAENALALVRRYCHDRTLVEVLSRLAHEETSHVIQVAEMLSELGLTPRSDGPNPYTRALFAEADSREPGRRIDLLLVAALIEERSHERLRLLATGFAGDGNDPRLADFYTTLANAEERHAGIFVAQAERFAAPGVVEHRLSQLAQREGAILTSLPAGPRVH